MNVFEFLGLPANHRTGARITQLVKHYDEVPVSKKSWPMLGQIKKDGVYALVVVKDSSNVGIFSRTGKEYTNTHLLRDHIYRHPLKRGVYIAELCNPDCSLEELSGIVNPNRKNPLNERQNELLLTCFLYFHDILIMSDFKRGKSHRSYKDRYFSLINSLPEVYNPIPNEPIYSEDHFNEVVQEMIDKGEEGIVLKQPDEGWQAGHKGYRMMKKVRGVSYDLLCCGYEEGKGKYKGLIANLFFKWKNDKVIKAMLGKGWTHEDARIMYLEATRPNRDTPINKIFEVYALQESSKGKLRLPKVGELRMDKDEPDI